MLCGHICGAFCLVYSCVSVGLVDMVSVAVDRYDAVAVCVTKVGVVCCFLCHCVGYVSGLRPDIQQTWSSVVVEQHLRVTVVDLIVYHVCHLGLWALALDDICGETLEAEMRAS